MTNENGRMNETLIDALVDAWTVEGPAPDYHRAAQARLRAEWPTLAQAIERIVHAFPPGKTTSDE